MNSIVLFNDPILGDIYLKDLIDYIDILKKNNDTMINRVVSILESNGFDDETIASILKEDISSSLNFIVDTLNDNL